MPKLGDMLRMDENGRFTMGGTGTTISDALENISQKERERREAEQRTIHEHDEIVLVDPDGHLCGYYELWQTWDMDEESQQTGSTVTISARPTIERRLELLRGSFANPSITPQQNASVSREIDAILSTLHTEESQPTRDSEHPIHVVQQDNERLITRDKNGLYLGVYSLSDALQKWPKSERHGAIINTGVTVPFSSVAKSVKGATTNNTGYSSRVNASLISAGEFARFVKRKKASEYWSQRKAFTYRVLHHDDEPVCEVPLDCLNRAFGDAWIVVGRRDVQLVSRWSSEQVSERVQRAVSLAKTKYRVISPPGSMCLTETQFVERERQKASSSYMSSGNIDLYADTNTSRLTRCVTRDEHGLFLGVFTLDEARDLWPEASMAGSVILVPGMTDFPDAVASISNTSSFKTSFSQRRMARSIKAASALPAKLITARPDMLWEYLSTTRLTVYHNTSQAIARLCPSDIESVVGNNWFLVSLQDVQLVTYIGAGTVVGRLLALEKRLYGKEQPKQAAQVPVNKDYSDDRRELRRAAREAARTELVKLARQERQDIANTQRMRQEDEKAERDKGRFHVYSHDGKVIYECKLARSAPLRSHLIRMLPSNSYRPVFDGIRLTRTLTSIGYASNSQFQQMCAAAIRNGDRSIMPKGDAKKTANGHQSPNSIERVSFDGPDNVLYVFRGTLSCERRRHKLEAVTGVIVTLKGRSVSINVNYCHNCRKFFLSQGEFEHYRDAYGPILGNFAFYGGTTYRGDGFDGLSPQSLLNLCGYNVNQSDNLTSEERHLILANVMDRDICGKPKVMSHLEWLIRSRESNPSMRLACDRWQDDLDWIRSYNINRQRRFAIGSVRRFR